MGIEGAVHNSENGGQEIKAFSSYFKITHTNKKLDENFQLDISDKELIFFVYGKDTIREAIKFYDEFPVNYHRTENAKDDQFERSKGLVATMEAIRTSGSQNTCEFILRGKNILTKIEEKYKNKKPEHRIKDDSDLDIAIVHEYLVEKYILGNVGITIPDIGLPSRK